MISFSYSHFLTNRMLVVPTDENPAYFVTIQDCDVIESDRPVSSSAVTDISWMPSERCWIPNYTGSKAGAPREYDIHTEVEQVYVPDQGQYHIEFDTEPHLTTVVKDKLVNLAKQRTEYKIMLPDRVEHNPEVQKTIAMLKQIRPNKPLPEPSRNVYPGVPDAYFDDEQPYTPVSFITYDSIGTIKKFGYNTPSSYTFDLDGDMYQEILPGEFDELNTFPSFEQWYEANKYELMVEYVTDHEAFDLLQSLYDEYTGIEMWKNRPGFTWRQPCWNVEELDETRKDIEDAFRENARNFELMSASPSKAKVDFAEWEQRKSSWMNQKEEYLANGEEQLWRNPSDDAIDNFIRMDLVDDSYIEWEQWTHVRPIRKTGKDGTYTISAKKQLENTRIRTKTKSLALQIVGDEEVPQGTVTIGSKRSRAAFSTDSIYVGGKWAHDPKSPFHNAAIQSDDAATYAVWLSRELDKRPDGATACELKELANRVNKGHSLQLIDWPDRRTGELPIERLSVLKSAIEWKAEQMKSA